MSVCADARVHSFEELRQTRALNYVLLHDRRDSRCLDVGRQRRVVDEWKREHREVLLIETTIFVEML